MWILLYWTTFDTYVRSVPNKIFSHSCLPTVNIYSNVKNRVMPEYKRTRLFNVPKSDILSDYLEVYFIKKKEIFHFKYSQRKQNVNLNISIPRAVLFGWKIIMLIYSFGGLFFSFFIFLFSVSLENDCNSVKECSFIFKVILQLNMQGVTKSLTPVFIT